MGTEGSTINLAELAARPAAGGSVPSTKHHEGADELQILVGVWLADVVRDVCEQHEQQHKQHVEQPQPQPHHPQQPSAFVQVMEVDGTSITVCEDLRHEFLTDSGEVDGHASASDLMKQRLRNASWTCDQVFVVKWRGKTKGAYVALAGEMRERELSNVVAEWEVTIAHHDHVIQGDRIVCAAEPFQEGGRFLAGMMIVCMDAETQQSMVDEIGEHDLSDWVFLLKKPNHEEEHSAEASAEALGLQVVGGRTVTSVRSRVPGDDAIFGTGGAATEFMHRLFQPAEGSVALHLLSPSLRPSPVVVDAAPQLRLQLRLQLHLDYVLYAHLELHLQLLHLQLRLHHHTYHTHSYTHQMKMLKMMLKMMMLAMRL